MKEMLRTNFLSNSHVSTINKNMTIYEVKLLEEMFKFDALKNERVECIEYLHINKPLKKDSEILNIYKINYSDMYSDDILDPRKSVDLVMGGSTPSTRIYFMIIDDKSKLYGMVFTILEKTITVYPNMFIPYRDFTVFSQYTFEALDVIDQEKMLEIVYDHKVSSGVKHCGKQSDEFTVARTNAFRIYNDGRSVFLPYNIMLTKIKDVGDEK